MSDIKTNRKICPECGGEGGWDSSEYSRVPRETCPKCNGAGTIGNQQDDVLPISKHVHCYTALGDPSADQAFTLPQAEYEYLMAALVERAKERVFRKAPAKARQKAVRLLGLLDQLEVMGEGAAAFLEGYNRQLAVYDKLTLERVHSLRLGYQMFGLWALLDSEYQG